MTAQNITLRALASELPHATDEATALTWLQTHSPRVTHVERLPDGRGVVVWGHIVCNHCRLCETQGDMRGATDLSRLLDWTPEPLYDPDHY